LIYWFYPSTTSTLDSCLVYHYATQRFGHFTLTVTDVLESVTASLTYADLDSPAYSTYAAFPDIAYDAPFWSASTPVLAYFGTDKILMSLSGVSGDTTMRTGWFGSEDTVTTCLRVRPRYRDKPSAASIIPRACFDLGGTVYTGTSSAINGDRFDVLQSARYHSFDLTFTDSMEVEALDAKLVPVSAE
jgi:hypothetical protein